LTSLLELGTWSMLFMEISAFIFILYWISLLAQYYEFFNLFLGLTDLHYFDDDIRGHSFSMNYFRHLITFLMENQYLDLCRLHILVFIYYEIKVHIFFKFRAIFNPILKVYYYRSLGLLGRLLLEILNFSQIDDFSIFNLVRT